MKPQTLTTAEELKKLEEAARSIAAAKNVPIRSGIKAGDGYSQQYHYNSYPSQG